MHTHPSTALPACLGDPDDQTAAEYVISDNGLRKICRRLAVPSPPAGWWAKKAAGHRVKATALPPAKPGTPGAATIAPSPTDRGDLRATIEQRAGSIGPIRVPERLARPHPVIARWIEEHRSRQEDARQHRRTWPHSNHRVPDLTESDRRRHRILHALFRALEEHGASIGENERRQLFVEISGEKIEFGCHEKSRQVTRPLTAEERRRESWNSSGVHRELQPTGQLEFKIRVWPDQPVRKLWTDGDRNRLEALLPQIAATFLVLGPLLAERTRRRAEEARAFAERQRQLELERRARERDDKRWSRFVAIAQASQRSALARASIARLRQLDQDTEVELDGMSVAQWLDWAEDRARAFDPIEQGSQRIFADVARVSEWTRFD